MRIFKLVSLLCHLCKLCKQLSLIPIVELLIPQSSVLSRKGIYRSRGESYLVYERQVLKDVAVEAIFLSTSVIRMLYATAGVMPKKQHGITMSHSVADFCCNTL